MSDSYTNSSFYFTSTHNNTDGTTSSTGHRYKTSSLTEPDGTTIIRTSRQDLGQSPIIEEHHYNSSSQEQFALPGPSRTVAGGVRRIAEMDDEEGTSELSAFGPETPRLDDGAAVPFGTKVIDVDTGAYDEHTHFYGDKTMRHHRELKDVAGRKFTRDVDFDPSGRATRAHERRRFENPETGTEVERESEVDVSEVL